MDMDNMMPMLVLAFLFMAVSHPKTYELTSGLVGSVLPDLELVDENGCPTMMGQVLHAVVLCVLVWVVKNYMDVDAGM
jgi:hypothetical protein